MTMREAPSKQKLYQESTWRAVLDREGITLTPQQLRNSDDPALRNIGVLCERLAVVGTAIGRQISHCLSRLERVESEVIAGGSVDSALPDVLELTAQINKRDAYMDALNEAAGIYAWLTKEKTDG